MNKLDRWINVGVGVVTLVVFGCLVYSSSRSSSMSAISPPDDDWFRKAVLERPEPVLVKFGAEWCGPCHKLDPELDKLASGGKVAVVRIDVDQHPELARHFHVSSIPDVYLFNKGTPVARQRGYTTSDRLQKWIDGKLSK